MSDQSKLHLGPRQVVVDGRIIGSIEDVTLEVSEADAEELKKLLNAQTFELRRINVG